MVAAGGARNSLRINQSVYNFNYTDRHEHTHTRTHTRALVYMGKTDVELGPGKLSLISVALIGFGFCLWQGICQTTIKLPIL